MLMARVATVALIVGALIVWWMVDNATAQKVDAEAGKRPLLFLGNESLAPLNFMKGGRPTGIVVDLTKALAERMHHPVEIRLMNWAEAQQLVLEGRADALLQINPDPERLKIYDFSQPLLTSEFSIFTSSERLGVTSMSDLRGLKVGVEEKGLPILLLQKDPRITVEIIPDFVQGFKMLSTGALDAVVADRWAGGYVLAENNIRGVKLFEEPIDRSDSAIAVKKGDTNLLGDINAALADIRQDGTYERIIKSWQPKEVVFKTREELHQQALLIAAITVVLIAALISVAALGRQIRQRNRVEATLRESEAKYKTLFENMTEEVHFWQLVRDEAGLIKTWRLVDANPPTLTTWGRSSVEEIKGKTTEEIFGPGAADHYIPVVQKIMTEGVPYSFEDYFPNLDKYFRFTSVPLGDYFITTGADITSIKKAEEALKESEERLRLLGDNLPDSAVYQYAHETDGSVRFLHFSAGIEHLNGVSAEEVLRDAGTLHRQIPPEYIERLKEAEAKSASELSDFDMEIPMRRPDGQMRWMRLHSRPRRVPDGCTVWDGVQIDVTERKQMEEELFRSRDELELRVEQRTRELVSATEKLSEKAEIIDFAHDAIIIRDLGGRTVFWSKGAQETYGFSGEEALGQITHDLLNAMSPIPIEEITKTVLEKGEWKGEIKHTKANGERIVVDSRWAVQVGAGDKPAGFLEVNRDITARKIAEEELRKADRAFRTLSEFNQTMVRQTDEMELLRQVCRIVADVGGYRLVWVGFAENDEDKSVVPIVSAGYDDDGYLAQAKISWADNERGRGPCGVSIRTGKLSVSQNAELNPAFAPWRLEAAKRGIASSISLPLIVEGSVIGSLGIYASEPDAFDQAESNLLNDLAQNLAYGIESIRVAEQRRRSEEELREYASRLELVNAELQDFAYIASHDLQEPLRKIQTFCGMAKKRCDPVLDTTSQEYLDRVLNSASRMRQLLDDLLKFSRVATRPEPFKKIDLGKMVREAAEVFEATIKETGCEIEIERLPLVEADETQMLQLFQNLIGNALKFRGTEKPLIRVYGKFDGQEGVREIYMKDNGIGFDQQFAELIFKPFERLHGRNEYDGTGMGLAICRKIAERHGGTIRAESEPGNGSTFIIRLPVKQTHLESIHGVGQRS